jgi:hypothetical protein
MAQDRIRATDAPGAAASRPGRRLLGALALATGLAGPLAAQDGRPVDILELYTSQGCSSCPPADDYVETLAAGGDVLPLSLHVDYWDYIGWVDSFANPRFTDRQKSYARDIGSRTIYTPQFIMGGLDRVEGFNPDRLAQLIAAHLAKGDGVMLTATRSGDRLMIRVEARAPLDRAARVQLVRFSPEATVSIERGENAGRTVTYRNIVTAWNILASWDGAAPFEIEAKVDGKEPAVVIVQSEGPSEILAASLIE